MRNAKSCSLIIPICCVNDGECVRVCERMDVKNQLTFFSINQLLWLNFKLVTILLLYFSSFSNIKTNTSFHKRQIHAYTHYVVGNKTHSTHRKVQRQTLCICVKIEIGGRVHNKAWHTPSHYSKISILTPILVCVCVHECGLKERNVLKHDILLGIFLALTHRIFFFSFVSLPSFHLEDLCRPQCEKSCPTKNRRIFCKCEKWGLPKCNHTHTSTQNIYGNIKKSISEGDKKKDKTVVKGLWS